MMHYYQFNIADYRKDTAHLTPIEHYIYRQLIDWYYLDEKPIPRETQSVIRRLGLGLDDVPTLKNVLNDFFKESVSGWCHNRIDEEIEIYRQKAGTAKENGRKGGRPKKQKLSEYKKPRKTQSVILANPEETGLKANQEPITNNHKPLTKNQEPISSSSQSSEEDHELAVFLWQKVERLAIGQKKPNLAAWANELRKMRKIDGRTAEEIKEVFIWANTDSFWQSNIRSPKKLREQFDHLKIKRKSNGSGKSEDAWAQAQKEFLGESDFIDGEFTHD